MAKKQQKDQVDLIRQCFEDGSATINGREYKFHKMRHKDRRKVFAYFTHIQGDIARHDLWFVDSSDFDAVEDVINGSVTVDNSSLSKKQDHWDDHPEDYLKFITTALAVISYPFMQGDHTS